VSDHDAELRPPEGLTLERHRDLRGREWRRTAVTRWFALVALVVFVLLALGNRMGQQADTAHFGNAAVAVTVVTPSTLREGLIFQTHVELTAHTAIRKPTIALDHGWLDGFTLNSVNPAPVDQSPSHGGSTYVYPPLAAGQSMSVWFEWSVNPTVVAWDRPQLLTVDDGTSVLASHPSSITVLP
jgi:hypothetical protein